MKTRSPDTIWYLNLPAMERLNIHVTREYFKSLLRESVSFDAIEELAQKGTDIVFIEKEGIIDELKLHADKYGVAMVNSRGYLTEYAHDLIGAAQESGANIIIITDYDLSGVNLASKCSEDIPWVTMDDSTLEYFGLQKDSSLVVRATNKKLIERVEEIISEDIRFQNLDIDFLRTNRIEINAVIALVGDLRFWKFIMNKLQELYPMRDYNRAIELPSKDLEDDETELYTDAIKKFILHVRDIVQIAVDEPEKKIKSEQENVEGFLEVEVQKKKNKDLVMKAIAEDTEITKMESSVAKLCESLGIDSTGTDNGDATKTHSRPRKKSR